MMGEYRAEATIHFYLADKTKDVDDTRVAISYDLNLEARQFGIKGIDYSFSDIVTIPYIEETVATGMTEDKSVQLDTSLVKVGYVPGAYSIYSVDLYLDAEGNVDYDKSEITCGYIKK